MFYRILLFLFLNFCFTGSVLAQESKLSTKSHKAEEAYKKALQYSRSRDFDKALSTFLYATKKDPAFGEAYLKAGALSKVLGNNQDAYNYYSKGLELLPYNPALVSEYYTFAEMSFSIGDYNRAEENYQKFLDSNPKNSKQAAFARQQLENCKFAYTAMANPVDFKPVKMGGNVNRFKLQYFPNVTADKRYLLYTARSGIGPEHDENLFVSMQIDGKWSPPMSISPNINTSLNEGAGSISGDGKTLVFTSCSRPDSYGDCDLYISYRKGEEWSRPMNLGKKVNSSAWDSQPSLSADGRTLYFSSSRAAGSFGLEDIYVTTIGSDGKWTEARNLGETVNSKGRDMAPFIHSGGTTLYFASDGRTGMGGLDMYMTTLEDNTWGVPENMGYPLNTHEDEGSFFITSDNTQGYYSKKTTGLDKSVAIELFEFTIPPAWKSKTKTTYATGRVFDAKTKKPIQADVQLYDLKTGDLKQQVTSDWKNGDYIIVLNEGSQYAMYISADKYLLKSLSFDYRSRKDFDPVTLDVYLDPISSGATIVLNNLFFDTGKFQLESQSKTELDKLIDFLQKNQSVSVEISGHTDDVGSDKVNQVLSEKRTYAVRDYLVRQGIDKDRIIARGYGKTQPAKPNTSEQNRQYNRRIEFKIL